MPLLWERTGSLNFAPAKVYELQFKYEVGYTCQQDQDSKIKNYSWQDKQIIALKRCAFPMSYTGQFYSSMDGILPSAHSLGGLHVYP